MATTVVLFHSVLGVRPGIEDAAARLQAAGHTVVIVDQYGGRTFDDYGEAGEFAGSIGFPELMTRAVDAVAQVPDGFTAMGFSNGAGMATFVALNRPAARVVLCSGAMPLERIGASAWPTTVPAQLHYSLDDPFRTDGAVESVLRSVNEAGAIAEYHQYPGNGHLFTDASLAAEFDEVSTASLWEHVLRFLDG